MPLPINWSSLPQVSAADAVNLTEIAVRTQDSNGQQYVGRMLLSDATSAAGCHCVHVAELLLLSADILTGFTTPIQFGITVPTGYYIVPISCDAKSTYGTTPYATNISMRVRAVGATSHLCAQAINFSGNLFSRMAFSTSPDIQYVVDADLEVYIGTGNPTAGDSDITLYLSYILIEA